jgi:hypothetical protein
VDGDVGVVLRVEGLVLSVGRVKPGFDDVSVDV